jgi:Na+/H+-dicarboxylate symporter
MRARRRNIAGKLIVSWWMFLLIAMGLGGNAYLAMRLFREGSILGTLFFCVCFGGACVYLYRTYAARDEIKGMWKD